MLLKLGWPTDRVIRCQWLWARTEETWWANFQRWLPINKLTNLLARNLRRSVSPMTKNSYLRLMTRFRGEGSIWVTSQSFKLIVEWLRVVVTSHLCRSSLVSFWFPRDCLRFVKRFSKSLNSSRLEITFLSHKTLLLSKTSLVEKQESSFWTKTGNWM